MNLMNYLFFKNLRCDNNTKIDNRLMLKFIKEDENCKIIGGNL